VNLFAECAVAAVIVVIYNGNIVLIYNMPLALTFLNLFKVSIDRFLGVVLSGARRSIHQFAPSHEYHAMRLQQNNTWVSQTIQMDMGNIIPDALPAFNDALVCIFVPVLDRYIFPSILKKWPSSLTPLRKIGAGILCTALSFVCVALVQTAIENSSSLISVGWQAPQ
jgi:dipeptide/tripeptide permease